MELEHDLHIRALAGEPAPHIALPHDNGGRADGLRQTTAVSWFLEQRAKAEAVRIIRISVYSGNLMIFWKSVQDAFARAGLDFLRDYACPTDAVGGGILADGLCHELAGKTPCYIFIDDFHLLTDDRACAFLCTLANRLPETCI